MPRVQNQLKKRALKLRKQGKSYREIFNALKIPKSTLSTWFKSLEWSARIRDKLADKAAKKGREKLILMNQARKKKWEKIHKKYRQEAKKQFLNLRKNSLFIIGIMLYWAEGDNKLENGLVRLSNTDPRMIKVFIKFLRDVCQIPKKKIRIWLLLYPDLNENICKNFWIKHCKISLDQFEKSQVIQGRHQTKRLPYGVCKVRLSNRSRELKEKIITWIDLCSKEF